MGGERLGTTPQPLPGTTFSDVNSKCLLCRRLVTRARIPVWTERTPVEVHEEQKQKPRMVLVIFISVTSLSDP